MKPWATLAVFENVNDGQTLEAVLRNRGLNARTYNDKLLQLFLFLCPPHATFRVQVRENDLKSATDFLDNTPDASAILKRAMHCPACDSLRVNYPQMTRKFFLPTLLLHLGIIFRVVEHEAYCENCHCVWNLPKKGAAAVPKVRTAKTFPFNE
jgi:hypothetical protein